MHLVINGLSLGGYWRIDNLEEERAGMDFLAKPWALVRDKETAEILCARVNASGLIVTDLTLKMLLDLLGRIHGDGGQYVQAHGLQQAIQDAEAKVVQERARVAGLEAELEAAQKTASDNFWFGIKEVNKLRRGYDAAWRVMEGTLREAGLWTADFQQRLNKAIEDSNLAAAPATVRDADPLADLVSRFSVALLSKLRDADKKQGHGNGWLNDDWRDDLVGSMLHHVNKGDPRDVAAYCAFAWHHGWSVSPIAAPAEKGAE